MVYQSIRPQFLLQILFCHCVLTFGNNSIKMLMNPIYFSVSPKLGLWVGIAEHVKYAMTFKIFTGDNQKSLFYFNLCYFE